MDLVLIRHPAVAVDAGVCYGQTDVPLAGDVAESALRIEQRMQLMSVASCEGVWHTSPLMRCRLMAEKLGAVREDVRLRELDFGRWEGLRWDAIERPLLDAWAADLEDGRPHGGESVVMFAARVGEWFEEVCSDEAGSVHVVTHAGVIRVLTARLLGVGVANVIQWPLEFGAIVVLRRVRAEWVLVRWNT
jgi:alpha-ribazole phosphatase